MHETAARRSGRSVVHAMSGDTRRWCSIVHGVEGGKQVRLASAHARPSARPRTPPPRTVTRRQRGWDAAAAAAAAAAAFAVVAAAGFAVSVAAAVAVAAPVAGP